MDRYHPPDHVSRMEFRRTCLDRGVRRSVSLDAQNRGSVGHHYDLHSLGGESWDDNDDGGDNDQRCLSPLPCTEGCRDLLTKLMSPMISSFAVDRSISLSRDEALKGTKHLAVDFPVCSKPVELGTQEDLKQTVYAARKSVRELYGQPSWWGDGELNDEEDDITNKVLSRPVSAQLSCKIAKSLNDETSGCPTEKATPRRQAEAFTIDLIGAGNSSLTESRCVPARLRRALQERQELVRKYSIPTEAPVTSPTVTSPTVKKTPTRRTADEVLASRRPIRSAQTDAPLVTTRAKATPSATNSPRNAAKWASTKTPVVKAVKPPTEKTPQKPSPRCAPNPLTQRNRIPLRQQRPSKTPATPNGVRKPLSSSPFASASAARASDRIHLPGTPVGPLVQSSRAPTKSGHGPAGSPLQRRGVPSAGRPGRQTTSARTEVLEQRRIASIPHTQISNAITPRPQSSRALFNNCRNLTPAINGSPSTPDVCLPIKPMLDSSMIWDPVIQEVWSYKEAKDYVMEKMFQGITAICTSVASAKSATQSVFDEFKVAADVPTLATSIPAAAVQAVPRPKAKAPIVCTPEERKELELFEKVEAEIDKFGENEDEALAQALSPLVEDFSRTWIRGKNVNNLPDFSHLPVEELPVVIDSSETNIAAHGMSTAASTVTLDNPVTHPDDHDLEPEMMRTAESLPSIAETYVLNANDTLAAEGIPPVVIYDSVERLLMGVHSDFNVMETSNTCTLPHQGTVTPRTCSPNAEERETAEALLLFQKEINEEFKVEADSISSGDDFDVKSNSSGGELIAGARRQEASAMPEYLAKTPCWSEKREGSKKTQNQSRGALLSSNSHNVKKIERQSLTDKFLPRASVQAYETLNLGAVHSQAHSPALNMTSTMADTSRGRIFSAEDSSDLNTSASDSISSSSSSSPLIDQFNEEFLQPEIAPKTSPIWTSIQPSAELKLRSPTSSWPTHSVTTRGCGAHDNSYLKDTWSQLQRYDSRCSIQSEYGESGTSLGMGFNVHHHHHHHRPIPSARYSAMGVKRTSDVVYPFAGQQAPTIRSTRSTASLDTALLLRDSQKALNEIARRIYRQPTHPTVPATPIQLPQLQNLSNNLIYRQTDIGLNGNANDDNQTHRLDQMTQSDLNNQRIDRSTVMGKPLNPHELNQSTRRLPSSNQNYGPIETAQSIASTPYSPPLSVSPISPLSISSATEPGHPSRSGQRLTNSNRFVVRRHSLINAIHPRADSPTPNDLFPSEYSGAAITNPPLSHSTTKAVTEAVKVVHSRPSGSSVTSSVPPMVLQRRPETDTNNCAVVTIAHQTSGNLADTPSAVKTLSDEKATGLSMGGITKPIARRFEATEMLRCSAFSSVAFNRVALRPTELHSSNAFQRCRRPLSFGSVDVCDNADELKLPLDPSDKSYEALLATSILHLSSRLRRCSESLAQKIGGPSSEASSPVAARGGKMSGKSSVSIHQELNDSLSNMRTVEQQLHYFENVLFGGLGSGGSTCECGKSTTETDYLQELERINSELRGFVPINASLGGRDSGTAASHVSTEAIDSGIDAAMVVERSVD